MFAQPFSMAANIKHCCAGHLADSAGQHVARAAAYWCFKSGQQKVALDFRPYRHQMQMSSSRVSLRFKIVSVGSFTDPQREAGLDIQR